jgi:hypothetical protein
MVQENRFDLASTSKNRWQFIFMVLTAGLVLAIVLGLSVTTATAQDRYQLKDLQGKVRIDCMLTRIMDH